MLISFDPQLDPKLIAVVGLGGTGSQWARSIARMMYDMKRRGMQTPRVMFIDPDRVEEKNVGRQMFTAADIGKSKAEVLAARFNHALGLDIAARPEKFSRTMFHFTGGSSGYWFNSDDKYGDDKRLLICGAVDNHFARREMAAVDCTWIDAGNHFASGQVVIGNTKSSDVIRETLAALEKPQSENARLKTDPKARFLPNVAALFPEMLEAQAGAPEIPRSCADLIAMGDQHLLINDLVATIAAGYTFNLLYRQPIQTFMTSIDVLTLTVRGMPLTAEELRSRLGI